MAVSDIYFYSFSYPKTKNYSVSLIPINEIWEMGLDWRRIKYSEVELTSSKNSIMPKFGEGVAEGLIKSCKIRVFQCSKMYFFILLHLHGNRVAENEISNRWCIFNFHPWSMVRDVIEILVGSGMKILEDHFFLRWKYEKFNCNANCWS